MITQVSAAGQEHLDALAALRLSFWQDQAAKGSREPTPACNAEELASLLGRRRTHWLVAMRDNKVVGYLFGQTKIVPGEQAQKISSIEEVMTVPAARRGGVARLLVDTALECFARDGSDRTQLRVLWDNAEAGSFWRDVGFAPYLTTLERESTA
jgi:ribosomal protein S18 acetylase RimI-like enzyme